MKPIEVSGYCLLQAKEAVTISDTLHTDEVSIVVDKVKPVKAPRDWSTWKPSPKRALWLAAVLPGGGQIYNRKFWKLPIFYGGFVGCIYALSWNNQMYHDYSQAYIDIMDNDPSTQSYNSFLHLGTTITEANKKQYQEVFRKRKDRFRRYRDLSVFVLIGVYALSIVDAYVDASLSEFDISDNLSLHIQPAVFGNQAPFYFDVSIHDIYGAAYFGAKAVIIPRYMFGFPARLIGYLNEKKIIAIGTDATSLENFNHKNEDGIDDQPSYQRNRLINETEETQKIIMQAEYLDREYVIEKLLTINGDIDMLEEMKERLDAEDSDRLKAAEARMKALEEQNERGNSTGNLGGNDTGTA